MGVDRPVLPAWTEQESREEQAVSRSRSTDVAMERADWADPSSVRQTRAMDGDSLSTGTGP